MWTRSLPRSAASRSMSSVRALANDSELTTTRRSRSASISATRSRHGPSSTFGPPTRPGSPVSAIAGL